MGLLSKNKYMLLFIALLAVSSSAWVVRILPELSALWDPLCVFLSQYKMQPAEKYFLKKKTQVDIN